MPTQTAARARHGARPRPRPAGRPAARRVSGPLRPAPAHAGAVRRGTTGVFERIRALPETRFVDGLLRGRAWIWLIGVLLGGIVAMQVSLLKLNSGISRAVTTTATLERQNANLEAEIARLSSGDRVRAAAVEEGMVTPPPGDTEYLHARGDRDPIRAARRMQPPSDEAFLIMENGGREPGVLAVDPATEALTDPAATATTDPAATTTTTTSDPTATAPAPGTGQG
jgi:cell division protein FtsL